MKTFLKVLLSFLSATSVLSKCRYQVLQNGRAIQVDSDPKVVNGLTYCLQYNGKQACCDENNDRTQISSYKQIDSVFGSQGGGCDICAINLKRFWCQYACSPRQSDFMETSKETYPYPSPKNPDIQVDVQVVNLTVYAQSACDLYKSCNRISFVTSVSAMGSPAGFLNFQGHNAIDDAYQYINVRFSNQKHDSLYFSDENKQTEPQRSKLQFCNATAPPNSSVHGFQFYENCTCNNCEDTCDKKSGFIYSQPSIFEGFNLLLVLGTWGFSILVAGFVTYKRSKDQQNKVKVY